MPQTKNSRCRAKKSPKAGDSAPASSRWAITEVPDEPASMAGPSNGAAECKGLPSEDYRDAVQPAMYGGREGEAPKKSRTGPIWNIGNSEYWSLIKQKATIVDKTLLIADFIESRHYANLVLRPRRFGKSMNLSMMRAFLDVDFFYTSNTKLVPHKERFDFFMTQKIGKERPDLVDKFCGRVPVLHLSLDV